MTSGSYVLVGFDGSKESEGALHWAVREARLRRLPLRAVHAWHWPYSVDYIDHEGTAIVRRMGEHILDRAVFLARRMAPELEVAGRLAEGPAYAALMHEAHDAEVIVVGSHGRGELPVGSTAIRLPARARRPVVVVRPAGSEAGEVVVGVDGSPGSDAALAFGFEQAALRGWRLRAVYGCWEPTAASEHDLTLFNDDEKLLRVAGARLEYAVAPWRVKYPYVEAQTVVKRQTPREAMFEAAEGAGLVVVGNRGTGGLDPLWLGATSGALLQHAPCAVAIVQAE
jgi:nucleotide-binding universal stress UspA family protein